jgi:hypothetical protein
MPLKRYVRTPLGEFATVQQAAAAHKCEKKTIANRIATRPLEYQYVQRDVPAKPKVVYERTVKGVRWPIGWNQYRFQDHEIKEQIYQEWCEQHDHDPDSLEAAEAFFDEMERYTGQQDGTEEDSDLTQDPEQETQK